MVIFSPKADKVAKGYIMKKYIFIFLLVLAGTGSIFSQIAAIDPHMLPSDESFMDDCRWLAENRNLVENYHSSWDFKITKTEVEFRLRGLLEKINALIPTNKKNSDLMLLRVLIYHYLYNLDVKEYYEKTIAEANSFKVLFPDEYRIYWLLGSHFAQSNFSLKSIKEFEYAAKITGGRRMVPLFWFDYANAALIADMWKYGTTLMDKFADSINDPHISDDTLYKVFHRHFISPSFDKEIPEKGVYQYQKRENTVGILCRLFGLFMPMKEDWGSKTTRVFKNGSSVSFVPPGIVNGKNKKITYTIMAYFDANNNVSFTDYIDKQMEPYSSYKRKNMPLGNYPFKVYEMTDPSVYRNTGGMHGYIIFLSRKEPNEKGIAIEAPNDSAYTAQFRTPAVNEYDRYDGEIYYTILLDCCEDIFGKAFDVFKEFAEGLVFD
jgi:hypothetical protein